ncbi:uncharacterized protein ARMOST_07646 [Armillaria ostoyae]|uniref:Uncharacterized protein n=1 Tax=Armillaria ostoyae TaxID=47428 RepID=A0A284R6E3_ARMOS|nr:uncharacterized protein ARMOST_07646 [Armillaria ostoyae]
MRMEGETGSTWRLHGSLSSGTPFETPETCSNSIPSAKGYKQVRTPPEYEVKLEAAPSPLHQRGVFTPLNTTQVQDCIWKITFPLLDSLSEEEGVAPSNQMTVFISEDKLPPLHNEYQRRLRRQLHSPSHQIVLSPSASQQIYSCADLTNAYIVHARFCQKTDAVHVYQQRRMAEGGMRVPSTAAVPSSRHYFESRHFDDASVVGFCTEQPEHNPLQVYPEIDIGTKLPPREAFIAFTTHQALSSKGRISEYSTRDTIRSLMGSFGIWRREALKPVPFEYTQQVYTFIDSEQLAEIVPLCTDSMPKHSMSATDFEVLARALFRDTGFWTLRMVLQVAYLINIQSLMTGCPGVLVVVKIRHQKGYRGKSLYTKTLAIEDQIFADVTTAEQIFSPKIPPMDLHILTLKLESRPQCVACAEVLVNGIWGISSDRALNYTTYSGHLRRVSLVDGFIGMELEDNDLHTLMGHTKDSRKFQNAYQSRLVDSDLAAVLYNREENTEYVTAGKTVSSMSARRDNNAPVKLPLEHLAQEISETSGLLVSADVDEEEQKTVAAKVLDLAITQHDKEYCNIVRRGKEAPSRVDHCASCGEWYEDIHGDYSAWNDHCVGHYEDAFAPFQERLAEDLILHHDNNLIVVDDIAEYDPSTGFGGKQPVLY